MYNMISPTIANEEPIVVHTYL